MKLFLRRGQYLTLREAEKLAEMVREKYQALERELEQERERRKAAEARADHLQAKLRLARRR